MSEAPRPIAPLPGFVGFPTIAHDPRKVRRWTIGVAVTLLLAYAFLLNPYWVPGGDSDFYVAIARSMARTPFTWRHPLAGFLYNGMPVAISPPGWPWLMALVMNHVSPTFIALKLTALLSMYGSLVIGYFIALRFLKPSAAGMATILAGLLMPVYSLTYFLHSEGLYCLLSAAALLVALRLREGRGGRGHTVLLLLLCVGIPLVRWAGIFQILPIVAVLLSGRPGVKFAQRHWKTAGVCFVLLMSTWIATRAALHLTAAEIKTAKLEGGMLTSDTDVDETDDSSSTDTKSVQIIPTDEHHGIVVEYAQRMARSGKWFSWLLWQPSRFVSISRPADTVVTLVGWAVIGMLVTLAVVEAIGGEWLWVALCLYTGALCLNWDNPNSRYFVPVAPLIVIGLLLTLQRGAEWWPPLTFDGWKWARRALFYSVLLCNLAMYGVDVIVMRSNRFYETFEAGQHKDLVDIAAYVMSLPPDEPTDLTTMPAGYQWRPSDGDVMVNERYENLGRVRYSKASSRAMVLLLDRFVKPLEYGRLSKQIPPINGGALASTMKRRGTEWLLVQSPAVPWRLWHFKLPMGLYQKLTKAPDSPPSGGWTLYHFTRVDRVFTPQPVPLIEGWPTRVPGM